jgi:putative transposase
MIDRKSALPVTRQCQLLSLSRSTAYYRPKDVSDADLTIMRCIDEMHLKRPFYGSRRIRDWLVAENHDINRKRVQRLKGLSIDRPNQVFCTDITYIPMAKGFVYLVAIMDWHSRKILSWRLSNTMATDFCIDALEEAIKRYGAPEIFNTDQGAQFTSDAFTDVLKASKVKISMDGKGRWVDNVMIERFWRSLKYEDVYLKAYDSVNEARVSIRKYIDFYNAERKHQTLEKTADQAYFGIEALPKTA